MFIRYILDFFVFYFSKCPYKRKNFFSNLLNFSQDKISFSGFTSFENWLNNIYQKKYIKIVVLGSGPSLDKLKVEKKALYLTTNSSVCFALKGDFIYFVFTKEYINTYIKKGFNSSGWQGSFFLFTRSKIKHKERMKSLTKIQNYLASSPKNKKEILFSDILSGVPNQNFKHINTFSENNINTDINDLNSGVSALIFGTYLSEKLQIPIEIYGIDAGVNGERYAGNHFDTPGKAIKNDRNLQALRKTYKYLNNRDITYKNHTFFYEN